MFPFIIHHKDIAIPTFFFMVMVASLATTFYIYWRAPSKGLSQLAVLDMALVGTIAGVIGARLFHVFVEYPKHYWANPEQVLYVWQGGFVGYGAFIGVTIGILLFLKKKKLPILQYADLVALGCPLIIFLVRVGCIGAGCCYGKPTDFFIHLVFDNKASDAARHYAGIPLHATQIYDMLNAIITFIIIHLVDRRKKFHGQIMLLFFMCYAAMRFMIEFLRGDADRGLFFNGMFSTSQITGIVIVVLCSIFYVRWKKKPL